MAEEPKDSRRINKISLDVGLRITVSVHATRGPIFPVSDQTVEPLCICPNPKLRLA